MRRSPATQRAPGWGRGDRWLNEGYALRRLNAGIASKARMASTHVGPVVVDVQLLLLGGPGVPYPSTRMSNTRSSVPLRLSVTRISKEYWF